MLNATAANAQQDPEALFRSGLADMQAGNYEAGCPKLATSHELDPLPGVLFTLAECESAWGKVVTAIEHYHAFVAMLTTLPADRRADYSERHDIALDKIAALTTLAPELVIEVGAGVPEDAVIKRNGVVLLPEAYGVSKRVDPGEYVITAERDGEIIWERRYVLQERDRARAQIQLATEPPAVPNAPASAPRRDTLSTSDALDESSGPPTGAIVLGAVGVTGVAVGLVAGGVALSKKDTIDSNCPNRTCNDEGSAAVSSAQSAATISTVSATIGLASIAAAAVWWMVAEPQDEHIASSSAPLRPQLIVGPRGAQIGLVGDL